MNVEDPSEVFNMRSHRPPNKIMFVVIVASNSDLTRRSKLIDPDGRW